ncbi:hypothetical protein ACFX2C_009172 [Malus domestica]
MASTIFVQLLFGELEKTPQIMDQYAIKNFRFPDQETTKLKVLIPLFKVNIPESVFSLMKTYLVSHLFQSQNWAKWEVTKPQVYSPRSSNFLLKDIFIDQ